MWCKVLYCSITVLYSKVFLLATISWQIYILTHRWSKISANVQTQIKTTFLFFTFYNIYNFIYFMQRIKDLPLTTKVRCEKPGSLRTPALLLPAQILCSYSELKQYSYNLVPQISTPMMPR